jgi:protein-S-isoprenylcysteine O-methyltransferase Ste14
MRLTRLVIECCWVAWLLYWVIMGFSTKRTVERAGFVGYRLVAGGLVLAFILAARVSGLSLQRVLWRTPLALGIVTDAVVLAGAAFSIWARITLGRNWSAEVTFKADHELIESGPYALARHPIYTGLSLMALGSALNFGRAIGIALFISLCAGLWWKAGQEERLMRRHFPDAYADYRTRVRAIIPFVL